VCNTPCETERQILHSQCQTVRCQMLDAGCQKTSGTNTVRIMTKRINWKDQKLEPAGARPPAGPPAPGSSPGQALSALHAKVVAARGDRSGSIKKTPEDGQTKKRSREAEPRRAAQPLRQGPGAGIKPADPPFGAGSLSLTLTIAPPERFLRPVPTAPGSPGSLVEPTGIEPVTSCLQSRRSPS
jgi:hypothetical protein